MKLRTTQLIYAYWNEVRGSRVAPRRFEIEPSRISAILPETFILECEADGGYRFRLAGTKICDQFGREFRGTRFFDLWHGEDGPALRSLVKTVREEGAAGLVNFDALTIEDEEVSFEAILMPLVHARNEVTRILGSISAVNPPTWIGTRPLVKQHLEHYQTIWPDGQPHAVIARLQPTQSMLSEPTSIRVVREQRRRFRVYEGGLSATFRSKA